LIAHWVRSYKKDEPSNQLVIAVSSMSLLLHTQRYRGALIEAFLDSAP